MPTLAALYRYPIKSTRGEMLTVAEASPMGLPYDRHWMVADETGRMLTGRSDPRLVLIVAETGPDHLTLTAPDMDELVVPLFHFAQTHPASVWKDDFSAWAGSAQANAWLSDFLGKPARLLYIGPTSNRHVRVRPDLPLSFADGYPLLLIGEGSLTELNRRAGREFPMRRFRPNLVIADTEPFAEDNWQQIRIGAATFTVAKPCERCVFTTVDPETGIKDPEQEPLRTLANFRKTEAGLLFGQNILVENGGMLAVGMEVEILA